MYNAECIVLTICCSYSTPYTLGFWRPFGTPTIYFIYTIGLIGLICLGMQ